MAADEDELELADKDEGQARKGRSWLKWLLFGGVGILIAAGSAVGALYLGGAFTDEASNGSQEAKKGSSKAPGKGVDRKNVFYHPLEPPFVVNFEDDNYVRFLQVGVQVMAYDEQVIEDVKKHMPVIRNNIVLLLSNQRYSDINTREGKEKLRAQALTEIQKVLKKHTGGKGIQEVYFTSFVMQ